MKPSLYIIVLVILLRLPGAASVTYTYDAAGHLTKADYGNGSVITYVYDGAGNLITRSVQTNGVTNVTSSTANGTYGAGTSISIQVTFGGAMTVTGTPRLALNSGGTASYSSGSGSTTLNFTYIVAASDSSGHLDYTSPAALTLNGGAIKDGAENNAALTLAAPGLAGSLGANKSIVIAGTLQCAFSLNTSGAQLPSGAGLFIDTAPSTGVFMTSLTGTFTLTASNCGTSDTWTATSNNVPILALAKGSFGASVLPAFSISGNGSSASTVIGFGMFSNSTSAARTGKITVSGTQGGQPFSQTLTVTQAASGDQLQPRVVRALYQTILGREPDSGGFSFWTGNGAPKDANGNILVNEMADDFYRSAEFAGNGWAVLSIYQAGLGHSPTYSQWIAGVTPLRPGAPAPALAENLLDSLTGSITNTAFVQLAIQNSWGRPATSAELSQYVGQLNASTSPTARFDFLNNTVFVNVLFTNATNPAWVNMLYFTILVRDPDPSGLGFWVQQASSPTGQPGIYYVPVGSGAAYQQKLFLIGQAVPPNPVFLGFLGSPEFQALIQ